MTPRETSLEARDAIAPTAESLRQSVLEAIHARGADGATDDELQLALGLAGNTQTPRRWELVRDGFVRDSGTRRRTRSGHQAIVWRAVEGGEGVTRRAAPRPTLPELRIALGNLRAISRVHPFTPELIKLGKWIAFLVGE